VIIVETDKITSEVEAPATGKSARILYKENETTPVTKVVAYLLLDGETEADLPPMEKQEVETTNALPQSTVVEKVPSISATALAKRMAESEGIDLKDIPAKGPKVTKEDVDTFLQAKGTIKPRVKVPATPAARRLAGEHNIQLNSLVGTGPRNRVQAEDVIKVIEQSSSIFDSKTLATTLAPLEFTTMRKRIADRLTASYQTSPHIYLSIEVDMAKVEGLRKQLNLKTYESGLPNISLTALLVKIIANCLEGHPRLNAYLESEKINFWEEINIGVATALDDGLIVPVIHNANRLSVFEINKELRLLAQKARDGELTLEQIRGGTFTISNLGMYGISSFTSILNPPQSAILSIGAIVRRPVVIDEEDSINVRPMMNITLGADHRVLDGVVAAQFLVDLTDMLEYPEKVSIY